MSETINIKETLKSLGIEEHNLGSSTGNKWFGSTKSISSVSPVDGSQIGTVSITSP